MTSPREYALLRDGNVLNIATSVKTQEQLQASYPEFEIKPVEDVPLPVLEAYQYWGERP